MVKLKSGTETDTFHTSDGNQNKIRIETYQENTKNLCLFEEKVDQESGPGSGELKSQSLLYPSSSFSSSSSEDLSPNLHSPYPHFRSDPEVISIRTLDQDQESVVNASGVDGDQIEPSFSPLLLPSLSLSSAGKTFPPSINHVIIDHENQISHEIPATIPLNSFPQFPSAYKNGQNYIA